MGKNFQDQEVPQNWKHLVVGDSVFYHEEWYQFQGLKFNPNRDQWVIILCSPRGNSIEASEGDASFMVPRPAIQMHCHD